MSLKNQCNLFYFIYVHHNKPENYKYELFTLNPNCFKCLRQTAAAGVQTTVLVCSFHLLSSTQLPIETCVCVCVPVHEPDTFLAFETLMPQEMSSMCDMQFLSSKQHSDTYMKDS